MRSREDGKTMDGNVSKTGAEGEFREKLAKIYTEGQKNNTRCVCSRRLKSIQNIVTNE